MRINCQDNKNNMAHNHSYKVTTKKLAETGDIEITSSIDAKEFAAAVAETLASIKKDITLPGFRKGAAPEKMVREKIGEGALLRDAAENAISHAYGHILKAEKIDAIGHPKVSITKIALDNPLEFTITTAVVPSIGKFDYSSIASKENGKKAEPISISDVEVEKAIEDIKVNFAKANAGKEKDAKPFELTDESVKAWGEFKDVADFKSKLRENLGKEKEQKAAEKRRIQLVEALTADLDVVVPEVLV